MSRIAVVVAVSLALAACGTPDQPSEQTGVEQDINVVTATGNDVTAIDAATGEDSNMAADVEFSMNELGNFGNETNEAAANAD